MVIHVYTRIRTDHVMVVLMVCKRTKALWWQIVTKVNGTIFQL